MNVLRSSGALRSSWPIDPMAMRTQRVRWGRDLEVHAVTSPEAIGALVGEWNELYRRREDAHPFQRPEWGTAWVHTFVTPRISGSTAPVDDGESFHPPSSPDVGLRMVTVRWDGRLVGLLPLLGYEPTADEIHPASVRPDGDGRRVGSDCPPRSGSVRRRLVFWGDGLTDYHDAVLDPNLPAEAACVLVRGLTSLRDWQTCNLQQLPANSALLTALEELADPTGVSSVSGASSRPPPSSRVHLASSAVDPAEATSAHIEPGQPCPVLDISQGLEAVVPPHQLARFRKYQRRAQRAGAVSLQLLTQGPELERAWETVVRLHCSRWTSRPAGASTSAWGDPKVVEFQRRAMRGLARAGAVRLYLLLFGERVAAGLYALVDRDRMYCYLQGFDPELAAASPGTLIVGMVLQDAASGGFRLVDFLRGRDEYKYLWGVREQPTFAFAMTR